ncbi:MAG TPA: glycyl radical protein [Rectinemataceae bacterium]|nr:glycyl radical protein [Rectinemataceae bacterium]
MNDRLIELKDRILSALPSLCLERARVYTRVYRENEALPVVRKRALALLRTLQECSIYIGDGELIVGNTASRPRAAAIFPEYSVDWLIKEIDGIDNRPAESYAATPEQKEEIRQLCEWWKGRTLQDRAVANFTPTLKAINDSGIVHAEGNMTTGDGHIAANLFKVLERGIGGYSSDIRRRNEALDPSDFGELRKRQLYLAMLDALEGLGTWIRRYAALARQQAGACADPTRKAELEAIAATCDRIAEEPPDGFREALQLTCFVQLALQIESNGHSVSLGRMDQYLHPFYKRDRDAGRLTPAFARELLACTWLKLLAVKKVRSWSHTRFSAGGPLYQNVTIGGVTRDGDDAVNELSYLILESVGEMKLTQPNLSVRYHRGMKDDFLKAAIEIIRKGFGMPAFNNDEIVIPGMLKLGVSLEDARDYSAIGCIEVAVPGKWGYRTTGMSFLNLMRVFLATLQDGRDAKSGQTFHGGTGTLESFGSFDELMKAWKEQLAYYAAASVGIDAAIDTALEDLVPDILCSTFTDDCVARGKHVKEGGAIYDWVSGLQVGIANLGNSLAAIKKLVFEEGSVRPKELMEALESDFAGPAGELLRLKLLNLAPKYGNDDDYVDALVVEAYGAYVGEMAKYHNTRYGRGPIGGGYYPGTSSISSNVPSGSVVSATPDGRHAWTPLAEGCSPTQGSDTQGPTAVFKSIAKLPTMDIFGGVLLNQKLTPQMLANDTQRDKLIALLRSFFDELKGWHVQYNIVSRETLLDAKKNPAKHRDLVVRVAGYSAYFNDLAAETQDDIIARTEQVL